MNRKAFVQLCCFISALVVASFVVLNISAADNSNAYVEYLKYMREEEASIGKGIREEDYYKMLQSPDRCKYPSITTAIPAAYLIDLTDDGLEELVIKRCVKNASKNSIYPSFDRSDLEWVCIYSYIDGHIKRIGQSNSFYKDVGNGAKSPYEPTGYIGDILSSHEFPYIMDDTVLVCKGSDGKTYLADKMPYTDRESGFSFYTFDGNFFSEESSLGIMHIPEWKIGSIKSSYGWLSFSLNGTSTDGNTFKAHVNKRTAGGITELVNNNYKDVITTLESKLRGTYLPSIWAQAEVDAAVNLNFVPDNLKSNYSSPITRAEFCALATRFYESVADCSIDKTATFSDTTDINVQKMAGLGIVNGVGGSNFAPGRQITRQEAAALISRLAEGLNKPLTKGTLAFNDNDKIAEWAKDSVSQVFAADIMRGKDGNIFDPFGAYTREQAMATFYRLYTSFNS